jgi:hypothetical protein
VQRRAHNGGRGDGKRGWRWPADGAPRFAARPMWRCSPPGRASLCCNPRQTCLRKEICLLIWYRRCPRNVIESSHIVMISPNRHTTDKNKVQPNHSKRAAFDYFATEPISPALLWQRRRSGGLDRADGVQQRRNTWSAGPRAGLQGGPVGR